ncbi:MAG: NADH-quinone oxidoreductase subunit M [Cystobacterineae bacterium]|nr:NADH-quinone oxidoreductase subunit M [Cystobacterineae bacterium]
MNASSPLLNYVIFLPMAFALLVLLLPGNEKGQIRFIALLGMLVNLLTGIWAFVAFNPSGPEFQLEYRLFWLSDLGLSYHLGVDGLAIALVLLTAFLGPLLVLSSWRFVNERVKEFHVCLLVLQTAMMGALCALDIMLFYIFFEAMLIPMYFLIGVFGSEERQKAALKFFLYTLAGSLLMLVALLCLFFLSGPEGARSFDYASIYNGLLEANREVGLCMQNSASCSNLSATAATLLKWGPWMFGAFALAFAIKIPMFPVHTWLPDAHVQAPVAGSMVLAGVLLKMGTFGFWRYAMPLFPAQAWAFQNLLVALSLVGIVYGALMCLAQKDIKKLIAYSSVSHMGFCMLGMLTFQKEGTMGAAYQMLNHGISTSALFLLFGMLYERRHLRGVADYGGIAKAMPIFTVFFLIISFSSIAVPGTNGFVGEFLVLLGTFRSNLPLWAGILATTGVIFGAAYMLWVVQRVFFGPVTHPANTTLKDVNFREFVTVLPLVLLVFVMGLKPQPILEVLSPSVERYIARVHQARPNAEGQTLPPQRENASLRMYVRTLPSKKTESAHMGHAQAEALGPLLANNPAGERL